ncbi:MAG: inositol monophosphatase [Bacteriovoracaceae bacterium]|nr:inositol monophosphatase [Bacteriovoracaceae bacterium]
MKNSERQEALKFTLKLADEAGKILLDHSRKLYRKPIKLIHKGAAGLASEADLKSEELVIRRIQKKYPEHKIVAEEDSFAKKLKVKGPDDPKQLTWLIDPLDGTNNFLNGLPFFCVSLALAQGSEVEVGVVHNPLLGETFYAHRGGGAFLRRRFGTKYLTKKLQTSKVSQPLKDSLISTNLGSSRHNASLIRKFPEVRAFRRLGSAALELSYVAAGILDAYWEYRLQPWDIAAGGLICEEAGVPISDLQGQKFHAFTPSVMAARSPLYEDLLQVLTEAEKS